MLKDNIDNIFKEKIKNSHKNKSTIKVRLVWISPLKTFGKYFSIASKPIIVKALEINTYCFVLLKKHYKNIGQKLSYVPQTDIG